jgi:hypothetical protein
MNTCQIMCLLFASWLAYCVFVLRFLKVATAGDDFENTPFIEPNSHAESTAKQQTTGPSYPANRPVAGIDGRIARRTREPSSDPP